MALITSQYEAEDKTPVSIQAFGELLVSSGTVPAEEQIAVAVSGGPDSMALCYLLSCWAAHFNPDLEIHALTVDHGLRPESAPEAYKTGEWVSAFPHVQHHILTKKATEGAPQAKIMEWARELRYGLLSEYCEQNDISKLYVAHHRDDQAETFLFRLAKGSGLDGLSAMRPVQSYNDRLVLCRPLLSLTKQGLIDVCEACDVSYVADPSNHNTDFARARLRKSAAILADEGLDAKRLSVTAARLARGREALDVFADRVYESSITGQDRNGLTFSCKGLSAEPMEIRLRVLQKAMRELRFRNNMGPSYGPRMERLEALLDRIFSDPSFKSATLGGFLFRLDKKRDELMVRREGNAW